MNRANLVAVLVFCASQIAFGSTKVGNGDDGVDLEALEKVNSGILIESRDKALAKIKSLNVGSIENLGQLTVSIEKSEIYLAKENVADKSASGIETSPDGKAVYARTFPEPLAATRFFPAALTLTEAQLITLHIHEGLHRSLPPAIRENENVVARITLAITSPDATYDRVKAAMADESISEPLSLSARNATKPPRPEIQYPSDVGYTFRRFGTKEDSKLVQLDSMHMLESNLHPFGGWAKALGLGIGLSYINEREESYMGPLLITARMKVATYRQFDISVWHEYSMFTLADDEFKNSPLARDLFTMGVRLHRNGPNYYVENLLSLSPESRAQETMGAVNYEHVYGTMVNAAVRFGGKYKGFQFGPMIELTVADGYRVESINFPQKTGRLRVLSGGLELSYTYDQLKFGLTGRTIIDSTKNLGFEYLGDVMGRGVGQGYVASSFSFAF